MSQTPSEKEQEILKVVGVVHEYLMDERIHNIIYCPGHPETAEPGTDTKIVLVAPVEHDAPSVSIAVIEVDQPKQWNIQTHSLEEKKIRINITSDLFKVPSFMEDLKTLGVTMDEDTTQGEPPDTVYVELEDPNSFKKMLDTLEWIANEYNKMFKTIQIVLDIFSEHLVWSGEPRPITFRRFAKQEVTSA